MSLIKASSGRVVADISLFDSDDSQSWEKIYEETMEEKYAKNTRNFSKKIQGKRWSGSGEPPIYLIPRERGGPSYKGVVLHGASSEEVQYCPISKGYPMQDVSSFTLGPIVGEGLCLVNSAFSKCITISHIEGGGKVDLKRKNFWKPSKKPLRTIQILDEETMIVGQGSDEDVVSIIEWLDENRDLWYDEWDKWRKHVALCSRGDFHWTDNSEVICYYRPSTDEFLSFVEWKKQCYIKPSYDLLPQTKVYQFLKSVWKDNNKALGLVHPKAILTEAEKPITRKSIKKLFDDPIEMCCQPYVIAGKLLGVKV